MGLSVIGYEPSERGHMGRNQPEDHGERLAAAELDDHGLACFEIGKRIGDGVGVRAHPARTGRVDRVGAAPATVGWRELADGEGLGEPESAAGDRQRPLEPGTRHQRLAFVGSSSTKTTGFMFQAALARISRTRSWPNAPAP